jgi:transcriptional regulator with XRE-family HTH domain
MLRLKRILEERGIKQSQLAKKLGVSTVSLSNWSTGKSLPSLETVVRICQILDVKIDELVQIKIEN